MSLEFKYNRVGELLHCYTDEIEVSTPEEVTSIFSGAFSNITTLQIIHLFNNLQYIGKNAFENCTSLINITLPDNIKFIDSFAFNNCISIKNITFPKNIELLGDYIFNCCEALTTATLSPNLIVIPKGLFFKCTNLQNIDLLDSILEIHDEAFFDCSNINNIKIPYNIKFIGSNAFTGTNIHLDDYSSLPESLEEFYSTSFIKYSEFKEIIQIPNNIKKFNLDILYTTNIFLDKNISFSQQFNISSSTQLVLPEDKKNSYIVFKYNNNIYYAIPNKGREELSKIWNIGDTLTNYLFKILEVFFDVDTPRNKTNKDNLINFEFEMSIVDAHFLHDINYDEFLAKVYVPFFD